MNDLIFQGDLYVPFNNKGGTVHFSEHYKKELYEKGIVDVHFSARCEPDTQTNLGVVRGCWVSSRNRNVVVAVRLDTGLGKSVTYIRKDIR